MSKRNIWSEDPHEDYMINNLHVVATAVFNCTVGLFYGLWLLASALVGLVQIVIQYVARSGERKAVRKTTPRTRK